MRRLAFLAVATALAGPLAHADVVILKGGGRIEGEVVEQRPDSVVVEVSAGRVTLPRNRIERLVVGRSALADFRARASRLAGGDVAGWLSLAAWARANDLETQARGAYEHVLSVDPGNVTAHREMGHVFTDGRWLTADESYRARGYVQYEGTWMRPDERQALVAERAAEDARRRDLMEADARVREAEARARAAEAEAERLEAEQQQETYVDGGIPYPWVFGGGGVAVPSHSRRHRRQPQVVVIQQAPSRRTAPPRRDPPPPARPAHRGLKDSSTGSGANGSGAASSH